MRRKHFEAIAQALAYAREHRNFGMNQQEDTFALMLWEQTVDQVALALATTNPHFDKARFLKASGR